MKLVFTSSIAGALLGNLFKRLLNFWISHPGIRSLDSAAIRRYSLPFKTKRAFHPLRSGHYAYPEDPLGSDHVLDRCRRCSVCQPYNWRGGG